MKYKLIYIEWCDTVSSGSSWKTESDMEEWLDGSEWVVNQCGFLIKETKEFILLAGYYKPEDNFTDEQFNHLTKIPKGWIKKRKVLKT